jgi:hypothetical protein
MAVEIFFFETAEIRLSISTYQDKSRPSGMVKHQSFFENKFSMSFVLPPSFVFNGIEDKFND